MTVNKLLNYVPAEKFAAGIAQPSPSFG